MFKATFLLVELFILFQGKIHSNAITDTIEFVSARVSTSINRKIHRRSLNLIKNNPFFDSTWLWNEKMSSVSSRAYFRSPLFEFSRNAIMKLLTSFSRAVVLRNLSVLVEFSLLRFYICVLSTANKAVVVNFTPPRSVKARNQRVLRVRTCCNKTPCVEKRVSNIGNANCLIPSVRYASELL